MKTPDEKSTEELISEAQEKLQSLKKERAERASNDHPDYRVPGEITPHLQNLGKRIRGMEELHERWEARMQENNLQIQIGRQLYAELRHELDIATGIVNGVKP